MTKYYFPLSTSPLSRTHLTFPNTRKVDGELDERTPSNELLQPNQTRRSEKEMPNKTPRPIEVMSGMEHFLIFVRTVPLSRGATSDQLVGRKLPSRIGDHEGLCWSGSPMLLMCRWDATSQSTHSSHV